MFLGYQIDGLSFNPSNPQNSVFQSIRGKKVVFLRILITGSLIPILYLPKSFYRCVGGAGQVSWLSDLWFAF